jgi:hypothetical protein
MGNYSQQADIGMDQSPRRSSYPIVYWAAALGAFLFAFEIYILVKWVIGPSFVRVPYGPSEPPDWMKLGMDIFQPASAIAVLYMFWRLLLRPWMREGRVTFYGLMVPILVLSSVYDPACSYFHNWYNYNAYFYNFGSPLPGGLPGWQSFAEPGAMNTWPLFLIPTIYPLAFIFFIWAGCWIMGALRHRFPNTRPALMAVCFLAFCVVDIVLEGNVSMRLGWYTETGLAINQGEHYQLPWRNIIFASFMWMMLASLWYFRNDQGQTFVERGLHPAESNTAKGIALRFFALLAVTQLILNLFYSLPMAVHAKYYPGHWPESMSSKTYFTGHICGFDTPRPCP